MAPQNKNITTMEISNLKPEDVWRNFYALTQVPRPSGHLEKVQAFLLRFALDRGIEAFKDAAGNIVMRRPATTGMERRKGVILQAHVDMVPQKTPESTHDFTTDPINVYIEDGWVKARGTTLGADNGLGVAAVMAVMEDASLPHGPLEALITADEETGMYGANGLPADELHGDILLNLDSETWGKFVIGSAGGTTVRATLDYSPETSDKSLEGLRIILQGLRGGHSGLEINEGRANANKLMARVVYAAADACGARIASWHGGTMRNAIPFAAEVTLAVKAHDIERVKSLVDDCRKMFADEYKGIESNIYLTAEDAPVPHATLPKNVQDRLVNAIYACHNGVLRMLPAYPDIVETSSNLAIIDIADGHAEITALPRSARDDMKDYVTTMLRAAFALGGMTVETSGEYSGWDPNPDSPTLRLLTDIYKSVTGDDGTVQVDHAGLECSVILTKYPHLDIVSFGPTLRSPHTTSERALIETVAPFYTLLTRTLANVPEK